MYNAQILELHRMSLVITYSFPIMHDFQLYYNYTVCLFTQKKQTRKQTNKKKT